MGLGKFFKKIFKAIAPILPLFFLFSPTAFTSNLFGFGKGAGASFIKKNLLKGLIWGYGLYKALNPPKPPTFAGGGDFAEEPVYSWDGGHITAQANIPVPVVCGEWFVEVGNVIDRELTNDSVNLLNPKSTSLYLRREDMRYNSELVAANLINQVNLIGMESVEYGDHQGLILAYNLKNYTYVYFDPSTPQTGWQEFENVELNHRLLSEYLLNVQNIPSSEKSHYKRGHKKFVFVPDTNSVYAFMNYYDAGSYMIKLDLISKKAIFYRPYSVFMHVDDEPIHRIFDWAYYWRASHTWTTSGVDNNCGFGRSYTNINGIMNHPIALPNYAYHYRNQVVKYNSSDPEDYDYQNNYMEYNPYWSFQYYRRDDESFNRWRNYGTLSATHIYENKPALKIIDGMVHYHQEYDDFSLQILVEVDNLSFRKNRIVVKDNGFSGDNTITTSPIPYSVSKNRFMIGLTRSIYENIYLETEDPYIADLVTVWNGINNERLPENITNREFYGLFAHFENYDGELTFAYGVGTGPRTLKPTTKQTEIYNLAYMVLDGDGPCPSVIFHNIHYEKSIKIEYLAKQPQMANWYEQDNEGRYQVNKSIGAVVSYIVFDGRDTNAKPYDPVHISHGYFSALCTPNDADNEENKRFDPFFIEIANFSFLTDAVTNNITTSIGGSNIWLSTKETTDSQFVVPSTVTNVKKQNNLTWISRTSSQRIYSQQTGGYYTVTNVHSPDDRIDDYLIDYATISAFYNYNQSLMASDIIYVPEHEYHLIKIENTWVPIRGWSKPYQWAIKNIPIAISPHTGIHYPTYNFAYHYNKPSPAEFRNQYTNTVYAGRRRTYRSPFRGIFRTFIDTQSYGYCADKDGQMENGTPYIINGKVYWLGDNYFYMNIDDFQNNFNFPEEYTKESPHSFVEIGWWNNLTPAEAFGSLSTERALWSIPQNITGFGSGRSVKYAPIKAGIKEGNILIY